MQMPSVKSWRFKNNDRKVKLSLSLNDGADWTTDNVIFQFYDEPLLTRLTKNSANLKGNESMSIVGVNFRNDITYCLFGDKLVVP